MTSRSFDGFEKKDSGTYVTPNFDESENVIVINVDVAVSSLTIDRY